MDDELRPQVIQEKPPVNSPNDHPWTPRRPMNDHPCALDGEWPEIDTSISMRLKQLPSNHRLSNARFFVSTLHGRQTASQKITKWPPGDAEVLLDVGHHSQTLLDPIFVVGPRQLAQGPDSISWRNRVRGPDPPDSGLYFLER